MTRILFADDGDISTTQNLQRIIHSAHRCPENPVLAPNRPWETSLTMGGTVRLEAVIPGHADVGWFTYDEADGLFRGIVKNFLFPSRRGCAPAWPGCA